MGNYPAVAGQGLYDPAPLDASGVPKQMHEPGTTFVFSDSDGNPVYARYCKNDAGASLAAGQVVILSGAFGEMGGAGATNSPVNLIVGGLAASMASNGFAWAIYRGMQTNASASASTASSSGDRVLFAEAANLAVAAATYASTTLGYANISVVALLKANAALAAAASNTVHWVWR